VSDEGREEPKDFTIPKPPRLDTEVELDPQSLKLAIDESEGNKKGTLEKDARRGGLDWNLRFTLKILLFVFVVLLNIWWDTRVADWIWFSGYTGGHFHLSDTVLVALATTSTANFLALILIIAKHLFPSDK
jgi:hypothetical protein